MSTTEDMVEIERAIPESIDKAAALIRSGGLVAFPTETVYGLGADATDDKAVAAIFAAKDRPKFNPLIVHVADASAAKELVAFDGRAEELVARFWPGALSLVLPRRAHCPVSLLAGAGLDTLAVRIPGHPVAQALIAAAGRPIAAPSANRSGAVSPTTAQHVADSLRDAVALILDGGPCRVGIESTVLDLSGDRPVLLRPGGVPVEELEDLIGEIGSPAAGAKPTAPGMLESHYAPALPLRCDATEAREDEALLSFGSHDIRGTAAERNLSPDGDLTEAAANLFAYLRELDDQAYSGIAAMPIPDRGLGRAINDRLRRAALPGTGR